MVFPRSIITRYAPFVQFIDLANFVTALNIVIAIFTVMASQSGKFVFAAAFMCAAAVVDFVDGYIARKHLSGLHKNREFGKQLDSLADLLNFSVAPAITVWAMSPTVSSAIIGGLLILSGCLRLAVFCVLTPSTQGYVGLPTTYAGVLLSIGTLAYSCDIVPGITVAVLAIAIAVMQVSHLHIPKIGIKTAVVGIPTTFAVCALAFYTFRSFAS